VVGVPSWGKGGVRNVSSLPALNSSKTVPQGTQQSRMKLTERVN
jgi:hypothetical protein